ncbi:tripartite tricarboxylate transporter substrate binding protein [Iocasia frigidifontis]|uniref:Tripartite tricarboxylate transporter substrate binding protein n=1 Tax=Iocasia fonsfrigidae TaxID=2682810 RepID=A0A8A7KIR2_9FIRM|nr:MULTISPECIES: tripartite tricarboxylate transporter substrate-binding protein [Halanaerobiaceae]AZO94860.1 tripartite tricarboxylate transporter substrate binding protein [Halocella sp. SP3-1]QTL97772.1 tripartite tricarboxylate transporter substrate binding protein [Iocasia fonsfrigidae]
MKTKKSIILGLFLLLTLTLIFSGLSLAKEYPRGTMEFIAPAGAGGGWDLTIRTVGKVLKDSKLVTVPMPITNRPGGGGGVNLAYLNGSKGSDRIISVYSPPLILINLNGSTNYSYRDTTPLARLITDYGVFVVAKNSKYNTIKEVMDALKKDPKSVKIGGTSSVGSMDHIQFLLIAKAAGVKNLKDIDYISFQGGSGPAQLLGGHIDLLSTGLGDVKALLDSGNLRALAQTGSKRVGKGVFATIPTVKEQGIEATFENWRGLFGAPGMPEYAQKYWRETIAKMVKTPEWQEACVRNNWTQSYADADEFKAFLDKVNQEYKSILKEIGMLKQ